MSETQVLNPGATLHHGTYKIERMLGQGGFGITYLATDTSLERLVAIKEFFPKDFCNRDATTSHVTVGTKATEELVKKMKTKFLKEARNIAKLGHPGIIKIYVSFEENNTAYYVMEYIDGCSLSEMVKRDGPLPESKALSYVAQVGNALEYIHARKINHLDVKPANIMVRREEDETVLIDFGLSKQYDSDGNQTSTTPTGISHGFAPIEQYNAGGVKEFSPQADIYSLGATLYNLLTGVILPQATSLVSNPLEFPPIISPDLVPILSKALSSNKNERQNSVQQFLNELTTTPSMPISAKQGEEKTEILAEVQHNVDSFTVNGITFEMVMVEGGILRTGGEGLEVQEKTVSTFRMGKTQVTQALWKAVMGGNPLLKLWRKLMGSSPFTFKGDSLPVECVSWDDCQEFIRRLNTMTGESFRLPTEVEWEYAARGGIKSCGYKYSGSNRIDDVAWYNGNSDGKTHPVATKSPNELGIYDMSGNVWEWTSECHNNNRPGVGNSYCVYRGGSWDGAEESCSVLSSGNLDPSYGCYDLGLRLAL